ncbi:MAG: DUF4407 domain-containing protein [Prevotellaceae bacterium]|jgi:hypothetical protein|nr:DUF4407 domain-containing protein [Prevotellaceae bacterium]
MNKLTKIECFIVGWKPEVLKNCREVSYAMLKKYTAAITILSIIWGIIGWCLADNYLTIQSWYGKVITVTVFVAVIVCIERYIILTHGKLIALKIFRTFLAVLMSVLGSTVFDQIVFKNDVNIQMKEIRTTQINAEIPKRTLLIDNEIQDISGTIDSITNVNQALYDEINKNPVIRDVHVSTTRRQVGTDDKGTAKYETDRTVTQGSVPNPKIEQAQKNEKLLKEYRTRIEDLQNRKLNIATEVRAEYEKANSGFLEELGALYSLLGSNWIVRLFYIFLFLFLMFLELLVLTTKGSDNCDYELLLDFQLKQRKKELEALDQ